jgi:hypothetical protein
MPAASFDPVLIGAVVLVVAFLHVMFTRRKA